MYNMTHTHVQENCPHNSHIIGCPTEWCECTRRFVGNSSFCQAQAFEVLTPTSAFLQFIICTFYLSQISYQDSFCLQIFISCHFIYNANWIFKLWERYHSRPSPRNKQIVHIVSLPARRTHLCVKFILNFILSMDRQLTATRWFYCTNPSM